MSQNILLVAIFAALFLLSFAAFGMQRTTLLMSREADVPSEIGALLVRSKNRLRLSNCVTYRPPRQIGRLAPAESLGEMVRSYWATSEPPSTAAPEQT